jgi:Uncharacterized protein conserved in bacteria
MDRKSIPKPGEIYNHFKNKPYQIITIATNTETRELMVVYQALYGDFKTYVRPLWMFLSEVDRTKYPDAKQKYRFELQKTQEELVDISGSFNRQCEFTAEAAPTGGNVQERECKVKTLSDLPDNQMGQAMGNSTDKVSNANVEHIPVEGTRIENTGIEAVNSILLEFLDAQSYTKKLEILTSNTKHLNDRLINDMAVALDCSIDEGPLDQRIQGLVSCLQAMRRFEDRRLR